MIRRLWWMALLPLAAQAADDFAMQWPLQPAHPDAGAYRVVLDAGVYRAAYWRNLGDLQLLQALRTYKEAAGDGVPGMREKVREVETMLKDKQGK